MRHPLNLAVTALWTLGGLYLSLGALGGAYLLLLRQRGIGSIGTDVAAVLLLAPGIAYMLAATVADRRKGRRSWILPVAAAVNAVVVVGLLLVFALFAQRVGVIDLLLRPRNIGHRHAAALALAILIAYHARLVFHLVRAHEAGDRSPIAARGFDATAPPEPVPLRALPVPDEPSHGPPVANP